MEEVEASYAIWNNYSTCWNNPMYTSASEESTTTTPGQISATVAIAKTNRYLPPMSAMEPASAASWLGRQRGLSSQSKELSGLRTDMQQVNVDSELQQVRDDRDRALAQVMKLSLEITQFKKITRKVAADLHMIRVKAAALEEPSPSSQPMTRSQSFDFKVEDEVILTISKRERPNQFSSDFIAPGDPKFIESFELCQEEIEEVTFKQASLIYFWRRAKAQGIEEDIADRQIHFWLDRIRKTPTSYDFVIVERGLKELKKLNIERRLEEEASRKKIE